MENGFKFINLWQTNEERQQKYWLARSLGANTSHARRLRDWRLSKIERRFGITPSFSTIVSHDELTPIDPPQSNSSQKYL